MATYDINDFIVELFPQ